MSGIKNEWITVNNPGRERNKIEEIKRIITEEWGRVEDKEARFNNISIPLRKYPKRLLKIATAELCKENSEFRDTEIIF